MKPELEERIQEQLAAGRVWRAKEILRGHIANDPYDAELYAAYGRLLIDLGELPEAGKYLLLGGCAGKAFESAIQLFVSRTCHGDPRALYAAFPEKARLPLLSDYPEDVRVRLGALGFREKLPYRTRGAPAQMSKVRRFALTLGCWAIGGILLILLIAGAISIIGLLISLID